AVVILVIMLLTVGPTLNAGASEESTEIARLKQLVKIDRTAAETVARRAVLGTVLSTQLTDDDDGYVVYEVVMAGKDGQTHEVSVDAGNGKIVQQETGKNISDEVGEIGN